MNTEMHARIGGKPLPEDNLNTVKVVNLLDEHERPITRAAHVDPATGTVKQVVNALIAAGLMSSS